MGGVKSLLIDSWEKEREEEELRNAADNSIEDAYSSYEEYYDAMLSGRCDYFIFQDEISNLRKLNELLVEDYALNLILKRQIFIGVISTMETFLSDTFIKLTTEDENYLKKFIQSHPNFNKQKFLLNEIYDRIEKISETAKKVMLDTIYHDLRKVREMYRSTFEIKFPEWESVRKLVSKRHDLVHRNGKTKESKLIKLDKESVEDSIINVESFIKELAEKLKLASFSNEVSDDLLSEIEV